MSWGWLSAAPPSDAYCFCLYSALRFFDLLAIFVLLVLFVPLDLLVLLVLPVLEILRVLRVFFVFCGPLPLLVPFFVRLARFRCMLRRGQHGQVIFTLPPHSPGKCLVKPELRFGIRFLYRLAIGTLQSEATSEQIFVEVRDTPTQSASFPYRAHLPQLIVEAPLVCQRVVRILNNIPNFSVVREKRLAKKYAGGPDVVSIVYQPYVHFRFCILGRPDSALEDQCVWNAVDHQRLLGILHRLLDQWGTIDPNPMALTMHSSVETAPDFETMLKNAADDTRASRCSMVDYRPCAPVQPLFVGVLVSYHQA
mmetsp:Transcript_95186/g.268999  ORF Transcript_95186/g.268999 Transcript_95186/m.268999 type:complete len:309 (+) Transcript_95186:258-1184(+)